MTWDAVARATMRKLADERWLAISTLAGVGVVLLVVTTTILAPPTTPALAGATAVGTALGFALPLSVLFGLLATATDPVDMPTEPRAARVGGAFVGTLAVAVAPLVAAALVAGLAGSALAGDAVEGAQVLLQVVVPLAFVGCAWAAVGLLVTGRCLSTGRAIAAAAVAYGVVRIFLPLAGSALLGIGGRPPIVPAWYVAFAYLDPSSLFQHMQTLATVGVLRQFSSYPPLFYNRIALFAGLLAWVLVPLGWAVLRAPPAAAPPPPPAPPALPGPPEELPAEVVS